jgi:hypothetical protein
MKMLSNNQNCKKIPIIYVGEMVGAGPKLLKAGAEIFDRPEPKQEPHKKRPTPHHRFATVEGQRNARDSDRS